MGGEALPKTFFSQWLKPQMSFEKQDCAFGLGRQPEYAFWEIAFHHLLNSSDVRFSKCDRCEKSEMFRCGLAHEYAMGDRIAATNDFPEVFIKGGSAEVHFIFPLDSCKIGSDLYAATYWHFAKQYDGMPFGNIGEATDIEGDQVLNLSASSNESTDRRHDLERDFCSLERSWKRSVGFWHG